MPVTPGASAAPATKKISVTRFILVQKVVPKGPMSTKPLPGSYGTPFNPFGLPQPCWPVPVSRPATFSIAAALRLVPEYHDISTPIPAETAITENDVETLAEPAAVETNADAPSSSDSEEDIPLRKRVRIVSPITEPARPTPTPRVAIAPMSSTTTVQTPSLPQPKRPTSRNPSAAPSSSKRNASRSHSAAPSPKKPKPAQQLRKKVDTRTARQKRKDSLVPTGKLAFRQLAAANPPPGAFERGGAPAKPPTPPQASSSGAATAAPHSPGLRGGGSPPKHEHEDDLSTAIRKEMLVRRANMEIDPPAEDFLD